MTTYPDLLKGGKHAPGLVPGNPGTSRLFTEIQGPDPSMPKEGDPLTVAEIQLFERWIQEGARDDTPAEVTAPALPPIYAGPPVLTDLAWSPDGTVLAIASYREILLYNAVDWTLKARLAGRATRIESLAFSPDGKRLAAAAGIPGVFGEVQVWNPSDGTLVASWKVSRDSIYGLHWSPTCDRVCFGGADKSVRILDATTGHELVHFEQSMDWVFGAVFLNDGLRVASGSRDRSMKLIDASHGALLDIINRDTEPVVKIEKHPKEDWVIFAGAEYRPRLYKALVKTNNLDPGSDPNFIREFDGFENGMTALAFNADGHWLATAGRPAGEIRVNDVTNSQRKATLRNHEGVVYGLAFSPNGEWLATAGFEGVVRIFAWEKERLSVIFNPVPPESRWVSRNGR